jgi:predicted secreted protein
MRSLKYPLLVLSLAIFAFVSCKKNGSKPIIMSLTALDSGKTVSLAQGQIVRITLGNPGDGGFTFNTWQYDATILHLDNHTRILPTNTQITGDFGSDEWQFTALKSGVSTLKISATRGQAGIPVNMFNDMVNVR